VLVAHPRLAGVAGRPNDTGPMPSIKHTCLNVFEWLLELELIPKYSILRPRYSRQTLVLTPSWSEGAVRSHDAWDRRERCCRDGRQMLDSPSRTLISIIDDDEDFRAAMADLVRAMGFAIETFPSAVEFLASPNVRHTSCLITDVHMPCMTGTELHSHLVGSGYDIPTILITAYPDDGARTSALSQGVVCYLGKPVDEEALLGCVRSALQRAKSDENPP
jgi:CheY-like chemotaxis protein